MEYTTPIFYFLPKDLSFSFYTEISHVAFCLRVFCSHLCIFLETRFSTALHHLLIAYTTAEWKGAQCPACSIHVALSHSSTQKRQMLLSGEILLRTYFSFICTPVSSQKLGAHEHSGLLCPRALLHQPHWTRAILEAKKKKKTTTQLKRQPGTEGKRRLKPLPCFLLAIHMCSWPPGCWKI